MLQGVNYARYVAPAAATLMGAEFGGEQFAIVDNYTFASAAAGSVVFVGVLMPGEVYLGGVITAAALGAGVTVAMGYAGQTAAFLAATAMNTANLVTFAQGAGPNGMGFKNTTNAPIPIFLTTAGGTATGCVDVFLSLARN